MVAAHLENRESEAKVRENIFDENVREIYENLSGKN